MEAKTFISKFEAFCPQELSMEGDISGLQIGSLNKKLKSVMMTLDIRPAVVAEAIEKKVDLIVTKHAPLFRPVAAITDGNVQTQMALDLIKNDIAVYVAHTNMDIIEGGLNDWFCEALGFEADDYLSKTHEFAMLKLAVFVPTNDAPAMRKALGEGGAGIQGNYRNTSYSTTGTGRFTPVTGANPTIGTIGQEEAVQETKIEVIFPETKKAKILQAMFAAHPYEEPAYDIFHLENQSQTCGIGRVGNLPAPVAIEDFIETVKKAFNLNNLRVVFPTTPKPVVQRIAVCGGSGEKFYREALQKQADVYITGDVYYHTAHDMQSAGLTVIDPGHYIETLCKQKLVAKFEEWKAAENWDVTFIQSEADTNPFSFR